MVTEKMDSSLSVGDKTDHMNVMGRMDHSVVNCATRGQSMVMDITEQRQVSEPEYEPFDTEKSKYIDEELMEKFHNHMDLTIQLRKTYPAKIKRKLKTIYRHEWGHITRSQINSAECTEQNISEIDKLFEDTAASINQDAIEERLGTCSQNIEDMNKDVRDILSKTKELVKSQEMFKRLQDSHSYRLIYETPPNTPEKANTDTECSSKITFNGRKHHGK